MGRLTLSEKHANRELSILKIVIEDFIRTASPVASLRLKESYGLEISPASIRNTLHQLEEIGYLGHLYTSSGRIPTDSGYRLYVNELMGIPKDASSEISQFMGELASVSCTVEEILQISADSLAKLSSLFGFVIWSPLGDSTLTDLELLKLSSGKLLLILGFEFSSIESIMLDVTTELNESHLDLVRSILRERLLGLKERDLRKTVPDRLRESELSNSEIIRNVMENAHSYFRVNEKTLLCTSSKEQLLENPEFSNSEEMQAIVSALDDEHVITRSVEELGCSTVAIGKENLETALRRCSVVISQFGGDSFMGHLGILGPTRLDYRKVQGLVNSFSRHIPTLIK